MRQSGERSGQIDAEQMELLIAAVERLTDEVRVLRDAVDELAGGVRWAARNDKLSGPVFVLTSMPRDPAAPNWAERVNNVPAQDLAEQRSDGSSRQAQLW